MASEFPGLLPLERKIWTKFRKEPPFPLDKERFNERLGEGAPVDPGWPEWLQRSVKALTQKRVDVIVESGTDVWIVEIKIRVGFSALGQLLGYSILYMAEYEPLEPPRLAVVAERAQPDIAGVLANFGIEMFLVPPVTQHGQQQ